MDRLLLLPGIRTLLLSALLGTVLCAGAWAQVSPDSSALPLPQAGSVQGTVTDTTGDVLVGATVVLISDRDVQPQLKMLTDNSGFFNFSQIPAGTYHLKVSAKGFTHWTGQPFQLSPGQVYGAPKIALRIVTASTSVRVVYSPVQIAKEQVHAQEKQRVLGIVPNFYTSYVWHAEPMTMQQKYQLAFRSSIDPVTFLGAGAVAGIEQWQNDFRGYGQGADGYAKRYGASLADGTIGVFLGGAVFPSLLHQDPRYFYKGTGSIRSRALYALSTPFITRGDNGRWQPNYSNVLGTFTAAGISNVYYPAANRGAQLTIDNALIGIGTGAVDALLQEFVIRKLSRGVPPQKSAGQQ